MINFYTVGGVKMEVLSLGQKIKKLRKEKKLTLKELAGTRITAAQISHIERDKSYPSQDLLEYFARKLGVSVDFLLESKELQVKKLSENLLLKAEVCMKSGDMQTAQADIEKVIGMCNSYNVYSICGKAKFLMGSIHKKEKRYHDACNMFEQSLILSVKANDEKSVIKSYIEIGSAYLEQQMYQVALDKFVQGKNYFEEHDLIEYELKKELYTNISYCNSYLEKFSDAIEYAHIVTKMEDEYKNYYEKGKNLLLLGSSYLEKHDYEKAEEYLKEALHIFEEEGKKSEQAMAHVKMAQIYERAEEFGEALERAKKAYIIKRESEDKELVEIIFAYIRALINFQDYTNAKKYSKRALSIAIKLKDKSLEYKSLEIYALINVKEGKIKIAIENLEKAAYFAKVLGHKKELADIYFKIAKVYSSISFEKEKEYYTKGIELYKELKMIK